ncbi:MAG: phenylalanine--tRNA ligase subunit beta [Thermodesulfobacteriota bacterium]
MYVSVDWLKELTPYRGSLDELAHQLTMLGLEVEEVLSPFSHLESMIVGHVLDCSPHPNADSLSLCLVDTGRESVSIVCGAPNVAKGQKVAVAPVGSCLPGGMTIKKAKIRGSASYGMICSENELGLGEDQSGIMVLDDELTPGEKLPEALGLDRFVFDIGITPNRADCLSILGIAREVAAAFDLPVTRPGVELREDGPDSSSELEIVINRPELCPSYQARIITGIEVRPSPAWMRFRLLAMGLRPINNVVDVTNYCMFELGQPLHAFDRSHLSGNMIRVDLARDGQKFVTLDNQERSLCSRDLLILDRDKPVALAGVMGGANSEITRESRELLLESAVFSPRNIRRTSRSLGISSDSSYRFERGVDQPGSVYALDRAAGLIQTLAGGRLFKGRAGQEPRPWSPRPISFRPKRAGSLLSLNTDPESCRSLFQKIECRVKGNDQEQFVVTPPSYRLDLEREVDLIEEIGRFYGFERIRAKPPLIKKTTLEDKTDNTSRQASHSFLNRIKQWARGQGFNEVINYSFLSRSELEQLNLADQETIMVHNPLTSDQDSMRPALAPGLLQNVRTNTDQGNSDLHFFEIARVFHKDHRFETTARENNRLGLLLHGRRNPPFWPWNAEQAEFLDLKGALQHLFKTLGLRETLFQEAREPQYLSPCVRFSVQGEDIGFLGCLNRKAAKAYHARAPVWLAELDLDAVFRHWSALCLTYKPWPKFPPVYRDMTLVCPPEVSYGQILEVIFRSKIHIQETVSLKDLYQPENAAERNLTLSITYRHQRKTLTDKEVDKQHTLLGQKLIDSLPVRFP